MILSPLISDGMVLQREVRQPIWGVTEPGVSVTVRLLGRESTTQSDEDGRWMVMLEKLPPGGPHEMIISSDSEERVIRDVLIGDVWVLGGQSNMELPVSRTLDRLADEVQGIDLPHIRQFSVPLEYDFHAPRAELTGGSWSSAVLQELMEFSAVGLFFARSLYERYGIPIGLIRTAVGGTPIEAWMSEETIRAYPEQARELDRCKDESYVSSTIKEDEQRIQAWYAALDEIDEGLQRGWHADIIDLFGWQEFTVPGSWQESELESVRGSVWFRMEFDVPAEMAGYEAKLMLGTIVDGDDTYVNGTHVGSTAYRYPPRRYTIPTGVLRRGRNTIAVRVISTHNTGEFICDMPYKIVGRGVELDLTGTWLYRIGAEVSELAPLTFFQYKPCGVYNAMIAPLRHYRIRGALWYQGESNTHQPHGYSGLFADMVRDWRSNWNIGDFPFIYAQLPNFGPPAEYEDESGWAVLRAEQLLCLSTTNTAMAVTIDVGEHNDLHPQDKKTVGERLALGARRLVYGEDIVSSGPICTGMERIGKAVHLQFDHVGSGLIARGGVLSGFAVCGADGKFLPAQAVIDGDQIIVTHERISDPVHVRYAWADNPQGANLYNMEGLPASPFTTEMLG